MIRVSEPSVVLSLVKVLVKLPEFELMVKLPELALSEKSLATLVPELVQYRVVPSGTPAVVTV
jgi:hypothetical protein